MGTYKVPQNVEAEDKILGPLSIKQFIYAVIGLAYGFLTFALFKSFILIWIFIGIPPTLAMLALGLYQREDQPLETYILAVAQFILRPKMRIWDKEPIAEVFHLQPPPPKVKDEIRDSREVRSQLQQLAELVDTRGWSAKEPELQELDDVPVIDLQDRIGSPESQPAALPFSQPTASALPYHPDITQADDMLDAQNPNVQNLNILIANTSKSIHAEALAKMRASRSQPVVAAPTVPMPAVAMAAPLIPAPAVAENAPATPLEPIAPLAGMVPQMQYPQPIPTVSATGAGLPPDAILKLSREGADISVAQVAAQAHRQEHLAEGQAVNLRNGNPANTPTA